MQILDNHVVLITGAGSGLGLGIAKYCKSEGARVIVTDISQEKLDRIAPDFDERDLLLRCDVTQVADLQYCHQMIRQHYAQLDAVIGAQGIFDGNLPIQNMPIERLSALFDEVMQINVKGYLLTAHVFADLLQASHGALVLTTSTAAYAADGGGAVYSASKGAIRSLVNQLAFEFAPNIRVNGVAPAGIGNSQLKGPQSLDLDHQKQSDIPKDAFLQKFQSISLLQELPVAEDYGAIYAFLASRHNKIMTGQTVVADQGLLNRTVLSS